LRGHYVAGKRGEREERERKMKYRKSTEMMGEEQPP